MGMAMGSAGWGGGAGSLYGMDASLGCMLTYADVC
jgi:hypothetical protein